MWEVILGILLGVVIAVIVIAMQRLESKYQAKKIKAYTEELKKQWG